MAQSKKMENDIKRRSRAPRFKWEAGLVMAVVFLPAALYPLLSGGAVITPFVVAMAVIVLAAGLISLSLVFDITPTFVTKAEADFQNELAAELYSIPVVSGCANGFSGVFSSSSHTRRSQAAHQCVVAPHASRSPAAGVLKLRALPTGACRSGWAPSSERTLANLNSRAALGSTGLRS